MYGTWFRDPIRVVRGEEEGCARHYRGKRWDVAVTGVAI
jgi:hypothetical protein